MTKPSCQRCLSGLAQSTCLGAVASRPGRVLGVLAVLLHPGAAVARVWVGAVACFTEVPDVVLLAVAVAGGQVQGALARHARLVAAVVFADAKEIGTVCFTLVPLVITEPLIGLGALGSFAGISFIRRGAATHTGPVVQRASVLASLISATVLADSKEVWAVASALVLLVVAEPLVLVRAVGSFTGLSLVRSGTATFAGLVVQCASVLASFISATVFADSEEVGAVSRALVWLLIAEPLVTFRAAGLVVGLAGVAGEHGPALARARLDVELAAVQARQSVEVTQFSRAVTVPRTGTAWRAL